MNLARDLPVHIDGLIYAKQPHGGISRNFTNLVNAMLEVGGLQPRLYLHGEVTRPEGMRELPLVQLPSTRPTRFLGRLGISDPARNARRFWSRLDRGVFHSSYYSAPDGVRIPQVLSLQDTIYEDFPQFFSSPRHLAHVEEKRVAVDRASAFVFSSHFARDRAEQVYRLQGRPTLVAPYAVDPRLLEQPPASEVQEFAAGINRGEPFLLHVGSRYLHKNVAALLKAYAGWAGRKDFAVLVAGGGEADPVETSAIERLGISDRVVILPRLGERELLLAYHAAHGFIFPSLSEGFGFPLLEALACGCPSAAANAASLPEVGGNTPEYFDPTDVESIRTGLDFLAACRRGDERWRQAALRARQRNWTDVARDYGDFYRELQPYKRAAAQ
jgi:glycosyltransferase involved in cell wall biosynthesis